MIIKTVVIPAQAEMTLNEKYNQMNEKPKFRRVIFYKNYFSDFFIKLRNRVKDKIIWTFELIEDVKRVPETFLKHIENTDGLYEIRVRSGKNIYRIFCFFDAENIVVIINSFQKKTRKTPRKEIKRALKIKKEYFHEKEKYNDA